MAKLTNPIIELAAEIDSIRRGSSSSLEPFLKVVCDKEIIESKTKLYVKFVRFGPDRVPKTRDLCKWLVGTIIDYAHPREYIAEAKEKDDVERISDNLANLMTDAKFIFSKTQTSGEFGELLIYALLERFLQLPQLVAKMDLKTSFQQHYNGADGIHFDIRQNRPVIIISESKMKKRLGAGITDCLKSLDSILASKASIGEKLGNEIHVVRNHLNINDPNLKKAMRDILDPNKEFYNSVEFVGAGLLCFNYSPYGKLKNDESLEAAIKSEIKLWEKAYITRLKKHRKKEFEFIFFILPFPSVEEIRREFKDMLGI